MIVQKAQLSEIRFKSISKAKGVLGLRNSFASHLQSTSGQLDQPVISSDRLRYFQTSFSCLISIRHTTTNRFYYLSCETMWRDKARIIFMMVISYSSCLFQRVKDHSWYQQFLIFYPSLISKDLEFTFPLFSFFINEISESWIIASFWQFHLHEVSISRKQVYRSFISRTIFVKHKQDRKVITLISHFDSWLLPNAVKTSIKSH